MDQLRIDYISYYHEEAMHVVWYHCSFAFQFIMKHGSGSCLKSSLYNALYWHEKPSVTSFN